MKTQRLPSICIVDDSAMTTKIYGYLFNQFLRNPNVSMFNHPWDIDIREFNQCDMIIIDEVLTDISGTQFIYETLTENFKNRYHEFPNVIFCSQIASSEVHTRIEALHLDFMIPSYRVVQKPITPQIMKQAVLSICPNMYGCIIDVAESPNSAIPWAVSAQKGIREVFGLETDNISPFCTVTF